MSPPQPHSREIEQLSPSFGEAKSILSRAQDQLDRLEKQQRNARNSGKVNSGFDEPDTTSSFPVRDKYRQGTANKSQEMSNPSQKQAFQLTKPDIAKAERQQLEAQLLVSKALARARANKRNTHK